MMDKEKENIMSCTTILVGKKASYDGSTMIARNDDGGYNLKHLCVYEPKDLPKVYKSVNSKLSIPMPKGAQRFTAMPNASKKDLKEDGLWAASGVNAANVGMTATETITSNARVLGADPYVVYQPRKGKQKEIPGGIGEEDIVMLVLPYIHSAREGVLRLGGLLEKYGTYEPNGIAFNDAKEAWYMETIGGHHWLASRVPDDKVIIMPNQFGTDSFDFNDALGTGKNYLCSRDLKEFMQKNFLDLTQKGRFNPRDAFGSHSDADHVYNTPRAWFMGRALCPHTYKWDGENAQFTPESDDIPFALVPERKVTPEEIKYLLSSHYQGTPYDPYGSYGDPSLRGKYRSIGISRTDFMSLIQIRPYLPEAYRAIEWVAYASNAFNVMVPLYANVDAIPAYLAKAEDRVSTDNFHWASRLIAALADASYHASVQEIERYQEKFAAKGHELLNKYDQEFAKKKPAVTREKANEDIVEALKKDTDDVLAKVLKTRTADMKNNYSRADN
jgi:dipeptidase